MSKDVIRFSGMLRSNGIPVSIRSTKTACDAIPLIKANDGDLRDALASIYLKNQSQRNVFDKVYDSFFEGKGELTNGPLEENKMSLTHSKFSKITNKSLNPKIKYKIMNYQSEYLKDSLTDDLKMDYIENILGGSSDNSNREGNSELLKSDIMAVNSLQPELIDLCQKLGRKIATKRSRRYKQSKKQKPDIRRTIRKNMVHGGTLLDLVKSKPKIKKQNHYFLSDVSVSCDWISIWFFCMIYAAKNSFNNARTFEFDNKTAEISSALQELNLIDAFIKVLEIRQENSMIHGKSNMYTAFEDFINQTNLNNKSYVLLLSDCRDWAGPKCHDTCPDLIKKYGNKPASSDLIREMVRKSKRVLILNPESKNKWDVADSCVSYYEDAGAECFEVKNLQQLSDLISEI
jgi:uncharacterized protein